jgi:hypothetical protein
MLIINVMDLPLRSINSPNFTVEDQDEHNSDKWIDNYKIYMHEQKPNKIIFCQE